MCSCKGEDSVATFSRTAGDDDSALPVSRKSARKTNDAARAAVRLSKRLDISAPLLYGSDLVSHNMYCRFHESFRGPKIGF